MRAEVAGAVAAITARAAQLQITAASSATEAARSLDEARSAARAAATAAMDGMHDFDRQLRFASQADADTYAQRAAERRAYFAAQHAKHTPEGDLNANAAPLGQMADAHAHGAHGPEFDKRWNALVATTERLREQVRRSGGSTQEFDDRLREDLRAILKSKGLSDAQIDAQFAAHNGDPLEVAKAFGQVDDLGKLMRAVERNDSCIASTRVAFAEQPVMRVSDDDALVALRASGMTMRDHPADDAFAHGVTANGRPASAVIRS